MLLTHQIVYIVTVVAACGFTAWAGGWPERTGLAIVILASVVTYPADALARAHWHMVMPATFGIDLATCMAFGILMLRTHRFWPIWSFGFCLAMVMAHVVRLLQSVVPPWSYYHTTSLWAYPVMASIVVGALAHRVQRATDRS